MMYRRNRGLCWASSALALVPITAGLPVVGLALLAAWACFMIWVR